MFAYLYRNVNGITIIEMVEIDGEKSICYFSNLLPSENLQNIINHIMYMYRSIQL